MTGGNRCQWEGCGLPCRTRWCAEHAIANERARHRQARQHVRETGQRPINLCQWPGCETPCRVKWCADHKKDAQLMARDAARRRRMTDPEYVDQLRERGRQGMRTKRSTWSADQRRLANEVRRLQRYGVTHRWYMETLAAQSGRCAICRSDHPGSVRDWHIDHDHVTGVPRALLCRHCNLGLGNFKDDPELLIAAIRYLRYHHQQKLIA